MQAPINEMIQHAEQALANAYAPYSKFPVAACIMTPEGKLFSGCNVENASFPLGACAETSAIGAMVTAGYHHIAEIVIIAKNLAICPPCGGCRQRIAEFADAKTRIHLCNQGVIQKTFTLAELLPEVFELSLT